MSSSGSPKHGVLVTLILYLLPLLSELQPTTARVIATHVSLERLLEMQKGKIILGNFHGIPLVRPPISGEFLFSIFNAFRQSPVQLICEFQNKDFTHMPSAYRYIELPPHSYIRNYWTGGVFRVFCSIRVVRTNCWAHRMLLWGSDQFYAKDEFCKPQYYGGCKLWIKPNGQVKERSPYYGNLTRMFMDTPTWHAPKARSRRGATFGKTCCNSACCVGWKHFWDYKTQC